MATMATQPVRLADIVRRLGGEMLGENVAISRVATLQNARPGDIAFVSQLRYRNLITSTRAIALILPQSLRDATSLPRIIADDPYLYFAEVSRLFSPPVPAVSGIHPSAVIEKGAIVAATAEIGALTYIGRGAKVGERTAVGPGCFIGDYAEIGEGGRLYANVTVYHHCIVGNDVIIHSGAVVGADGFGMAPKDGKWLKIPQTGRAIIGNDVEIGANTTIDRGALDDTIIEDGVKLDNQIQIGHNVRIGANSALAGCVGVAGSANIGRNCTVGGGAVILGHLEIADHVHVSAATLITKSISKPGTYTGAYPFSEHKQWSRSASTLRHLDELSRQIKDLASPSKTKKVARSTGKYSAVKRAQAAMPRKKG
jgi:UDP-3-O-[3-hydroxymyristoyl] glucosamine N-acyltransferase